MKNTQMIVFDMAGTVVDENNIVYKTVQKTINDAGFNVSLDQVLEQGAGKEKLQAIKSVLAVHAGNNDHQQALNIYQHFTQELATAYQTTAIYAQPEAEKLFKELKKRDILVVFNTGYNRETAEFIINKLGWVEGEEFDGLVTATDVQRNRPDPAMIKFAMERFQVDNAANVIKVGDSIIDIEEGQNAGCGLSIGITTGAHTEEQLASAHPDKIIHNLIELLAIID